MGDKGQRSGVRVEGEEGKGGGEEGREEEGREEEERCKEGRGEVRTETPGIYFWTGYSYIN